MDSLKKIMTSGLCAYAMVFASKVSAWGTTPATSAEPIGVPTDIEAAIMSITNYILGFIVMIATLIVIYGGVLYLTAAGSDDQIGKAKSTISAGLIGVIIAGLAYALVIVVTKVISA